MNNSKKNEWKVPLFKIYTDDEDLNIVTKIIKRGRDWAVGPEIGELENAVKNYVGMDYCAVLNSGTSALHASLLAYNIKKNDEVIVPSFSFISTSNSVLFVGGIPKFADIEEITYGLNPNSVTQKIGPNTKAIMPMDYGGMSCDIYAIKKIADDNNLLLIEDAAESLGSSIHGKKVGTLSHTSIFSFCGNKVLTTGEGGAIVTNSLDIYEKIKLIRSHGRKDIISFFDNPSNSQYVNLGYNWRMSSITAALGISQLNKLDKLIKMRQDNAKFLSNRLSKFKEIKVPNPPNGYEHVYQMYTIRLPNSQIRDGLHSFLTEKRILSKIYFEPIHKNPYYANSFPEVSKDLSVTELVSQQVLTLPMYPNMLTEEKNYVVDSISEFFE